MYKVVRMYRDRPHRNRTVRSGLTLEQAQAHCRDPETNSSTCTNYAGRRRTRQFGPWYDGYEET